MDPLTQKYATFKTSRGSFEPLVMFFGLCNTPATFQSMMNHLFKDLIDKGYVTIYMDDILIHTPQDYELHQRIVNQVLQIMSDNDLPAKPKKCKFEVEEVSYLGFIIREGFTGMDPVKVEGVKNWKMPTTLKEV